ncbi:nascent polypeptide-associated complex subunit alpha-like protein 1 [Tanacetum coccineum]
MQRDGPLAEDDEDDNNDIEEDDGEGTNKTNNGDCNGRSRQTRSKKKCRKGKLKTGMKPVTRVSRVTVKKSKNIHSHAAEFKAPNFINAGYKSEPAAATAQDDEDVDETRVEPKDIELVMGQRGAFAMVQGFRGALQGCRKGHCVCNMESQLKYCFLRRYDLLQILFYESE